MAAEETVDARLAQRVCAMEVFPRFYHGRHDPWNAYENLMLKPSAEPCSISRPSIARLGTLDMLPAELVIAILEALDFQSLSRFSRASMRANNVVQILPAYRIVMTHATGPLTVLAATKLLPQHSASSLSDALRSARCVACQQFGAYLFLPGCERACGDCLSRKMAFALAIPSRITEYFGLSSEQVATLPALVDLDGHFYNDPQRLPGFIMLGDGGRPLISLKQARQLALRLGVCKNPIESWRFDNPNVYARYAIGTFPFRREITSFPSTVEKYMFPGDDDFGSYEFTGMTHVRFPSLGRDASVEYGQWCRGCIETQDLFLLDILPKKVEEQARKDGLGGCPATHISSHASRLWSKETLREHVTHCYGARLICARWKRVHDAIKQARFVLRGTATATS